MSSHKQPVLFARRTSERRRLKLINNSNSFKTPNPFRLSHTSLIPQEIYKQLMKIEFLSNSVISHLSFERRKTQSLCEQRMLSKMQEAIHLQEVKYNALIGIESITPFCEGESNKATEEKAFGEGEEIVQTKDWISRNIFDPYDPRREDGFICDQLLVGSGELAVLKSSLVQGEVGAGLVLLPEEQYQNYFAQ